jgi:hypothetical protein
MLGLLGIGRRKTAPCNSNYGLLGFRIAPDVKASLHSEGVVLIDIRRGTVFSANRVGAMIWNAATERWTLDRISESISSEFHIPVQAARVDAAEFVEQLAREGLLVPETN